MILTKEDLLFLLLLLKEEACPVESFKGCDKCIIYKQCGAIHDMASSMSEVYTLRNKNVQHILDQIPQEYMFELLL